MYGTGRESTFQYWPELAQAIQDADIVWDIVLYGCNVWHCLLFIYIFCVIYVVCIGVYHISIELWIATESYSVSPM